MASVAIFEHIIASFYGIVFLPESRSQESTFWRCELSYRPKKRKERILTDLVLLSFSLSFATSLGHMILQCECNIAIQAAIKLGRSTLKCCAFDCRQQGMIKAHDADMRGICQIGAYECLCHLCVETVLIFRNAPVGSCKIALKGKLQPPFGYRNVSRF